MMFRFLWVFFLALPLSTVAQQAEQQSVLTKKISITLLNTPRESILKTLQKEYDVNFFYSNDLNELKENASVHVKDKSLSETLMALFQNSSIDFTELNGTIVLRKKQAVATPAHEKTADTSSLTSNTDKILKNKISTQTTEETGTKNRLCISCLFSKNKSEIPVLSTGKSRPDTLDSLKNDTIEKPLRKAKRPIIYHAEDFRSAISVSAGPAYTYRILKGLSSTGKNIETKRNRHDEKALSWITEVGYRHKIYRSVFFETGLKYLFLQSSGSFNYDSYTNLLSRTVNYKDNYEYLIIPLGAGSRKDFKKFYFSFATVFDFSLLTNYNFTIDHYDYFWYKEITEVDINNPQYEKFFKNKDKNQAIIITESVITDSEELQKKELSRLAASVNFNLALGYKLSKRLDLKISPGASFFISSLYKSGAPIKEKPYYIYMNTGLNYNF